MIHCTRDMLNAYFVQTRVRRRVYVQENESKRNRAVKRAGDERKQREQKEQEIIKLKKQCKERQDEETRLRRDLEEHRRYHDFLAQAGGVGWWIDFSFAPQR